MTAFQRADPTELVFRTEASVRVGMLPTDEQLAIIRGKAPDPSVFETKPPFSWRAESSSGRLDSYFTRMHSTSLKNYVEDAISGVMFLDSHVRRQLGYGQSFWGSFESGTPEDEENPPKALLDFFTIPDVKLNSVDTNSFIDAVRAGVIRDVSIGFNPGTVECNICGNDPFDWWDSECIHIPGAYYDSKGKMVTKSTKGALQAFAWIKDARLNEVSAVYDGATPGAHILKAQYLAEAGQLARAMIPMLERQLRCRLPEPPLIITGSRVERGRAIINGTEYREGMDIPMAFRRLGEQERQSGEQKPPEDKQAEEAQSSGTLETENLKRGEDPESVAESTGGITSPSHTTVEDLRMNEQEQREAQAKLEAHDRLMTQIRQALQAAGVEDAASVDVAAAIGTLGARVAELMPLAKQGEAYRTDTIETALRYGVAANGNDWPRERYEKVLKALPELDDIKLMRDEWQKAAEARLGGGRLTSETNNDPPKSGDRQNGVAATAQFKTS